MTNMSKEELASCFADHAGVQTAASFQKAYADALSQAKSDGGMVVICGSLYLASEVLQQITADEQTRL